jgi:hypothetical protein
MVLTTVRDSSTIATPQQLEGTYSAIPGAYYNSAPAGMVGNATDPNTAYGPMLGSTALGASRPIEAVRGYGAGRGQPMGSTVSGRSALYQDIGAQAQFGSAAKWNAAVNNLNAPAIQGARANYIRKAGPSGQPRATFAGLTAQVGSPTAWAAVAPAMEAANQFGNPKVEFFG